jgi:hypothetical protein
MRNPKTAGQTIGEDDIDAPLKAIQNVVNCANSPHSQVI